MQSDPMYWLKNLIITAREKDDDDEGEDDGQDDEGNDADDDGEEGQGEEDAGDDDFKDAQGNIDWEAKAKAQEKALQKERRFRRKAERDAKRLKKAAKPAERADDADDDGDDQGAAAKAKADDKLRRKLAREESKNQKLADGIRKQKIDSAIEKVARKMGFIDPTDAVTDDIRAEVDWEQDSEDPSQVEIDMDSVQEAVEDLADRKKHLIGTPGEGKPKSGGKFKRKQNSSDDGDASKQVLLENYPSLR